jgi:hypothetical protein
MSAVALLRLSGLALLLGGTLGVIGLLVHPPGHELAQQLSPTWVPAHALILSGWSLVILGLPGLYARQASHAGPLGLVAIAVALPAAALRIAVQVYELFVVATLAADPSLQVLTGSQGTLERGPMGVLLVIVMLGSSASYILLGLATIRAALLPRRAGLLLVLAGVPLLGGPVALPLAALGFGLASLALAWLGRALSGDRHFSPASSVASLLRTEEAPARRS